LEKYERQIELLKGENSSSQTTDFSTELSKSLSTINQKRVEIEKLKETIETLQDHAKDKDKVINEYQKIKANLVVEIEKMKHKKDGKAYLIGARHLIWDRIVT
jgi:DNA repair exonuclease SbcCD ATPase subunit